MDQTDADIHAYYWLKKKRDSMDAYLVKLNKRIKGALAKDLQNNKAVRQSGGYRAEVTLRESKPKSDEGALGYLLESLGLFDECTKLVIDHDLVEQAYINGKLTDDHLRTIGAEPSFSLSLHVDKVDDEEFIKE